MFDEYMENRESLDAYVRWLKKIGREVGVGKDYKKDGEGGILPYFNTKCNSHRCVYDISRLREVYDEVAGLDQPVDDNEEFACQYCMEKIKFGDFYTCDQLRELVEEQVVNVDDGDSDGEEEDDGDDEDDDDDSRQDASNRTLETTDDMDIDFNREVPDINLFNDIEVEEYCYIIDTQKREKIFKVIQGSFTFSTTKNFKVPINDFTKMIRNREFNIELYDIILFEYWRQVFVKTVRKKLPLYYYFIENDEGRRPSIQVRDLASKKMNKEEVMINEKAIFVLGTSKGMNLFVYDYIEERLTYISADKKEHLSDDVESGILMKKFQLFNTFNKMWFKEDPIEIKLMSNSLLEISNNLAKKVFVHYYIAQDEIVLPKNKMVNFFDVLLWVLFKLNMKTKEELTESEPEEPDPFTNPGLSIMPETQADKQGEKEKNKESQKHPGQKVNPEQIKSFQNFYTLLWYYYYYDRNRYKQIWKEYEKKFSTAILKQAGMDPNTLMQDFVPENIPSEEDTSESSISQSKKKNSSTKPGDLTGFAQMAKLNSSSSLKGKHVNFEGSFNDSAKGNNILPMLRTPTQAVQPQVQHQKGPPVMIMESLPPIDAYRPKLINTDKMMGESRVMQIHRNNVRVFPHLYEDSLERAKKYNSPVIQDSAVVDRRMNVISKEEAEKFEKSGYMTENMLNYFIEYVREKQEKMDQDLLKRYNLKAYFFPTDFYKLFVNDLSKKFLVTKYERVKKMTTPYTKPKPLVFEVFQKIFIPVIEIINATHTYKLVVIDTFKRSITLYDPITSRQKEEEPKDNKHLIAVANFIEQEYYDKAQIDADVVNTWEYVIADCTTTDDAGHSALFVCNFIYILIKGMKQPFFKGKDLNGLIAKISQTVKRKMGNMY